MLLSSLAEKIESSLHSFMHWLEAYGFKSYDQFDFWGSKIGVNSKLLFEKNKIVAAPIVLFFQLLESYFPESRVLFAKKNRFAIGDAHFALGFMNLYKFYNDEKYLFMAKDLLYVLSLYSTETTSGIGWGYPYTWVTPAITFPPGTPFITVSPYCFYAFLEMYQITGEKKWLPYVEQIAQYAAYDLNEFEISQNEIAASYSNIDNELVINANAYRAALLLKAYEIFKVEEYRDKAEKSINYVINRQNENGSWYYSDNSLFIDNFHTCFVLKNLYKSYLFNNNEKILESVQFGYEYYRNNLFRKDNTPIHFAKIRYPKFRKIEMYDYAEGISLGVLLKDDIEGPLEFAKLMAEDLVDKFQLDEGYFITRISTLGKKNKTPYLRWPQAQLFFALTNMLITIRGD